MARTSVSVSVFLTLLCFGYLVNFCGANQNFEKYFEHVGPNTPADIQIKAAEDVISRVLPNLSKNFTVFISKQLPRNTFELIKRENSSHFVEIHGSDGISVCKGFHYYLKYYLNGHISWSGDRLPIDILELPNVNLRHTAPNRFIYHQNVCTWSYSFAWWTWNDWRRHIDWMAMMGISLTIAPIQEEIWTKVYKEIGLTEDEYLDHFAGPAFQAWQRMGNIRGWGGPLSKSYRRQQMLLQKRIINAQRELGMSVAIPAFAGHVPLAFQRIYPNVTLTPVERWNRFPDHFCCPLFLDPNEKLFHEIGKKFLTAIIEEYGTDHIYFSDPFNEVNPRTNELNYIAKTSANIYNTMSAVDPSSIWLLQNWMFVHSATFWELKMQEAFLTAVPRGSLLVLDLQSEQSPQYENTNSYFGQPFIWCMLHNFGGTLGMHGSAKIVNTRIRYAREMLNSTMIGVGITPEGINQNYPMYELALERGWMQDDFVLENWFRHYAKGRYGVDDDNLAAGWNHLLDSVYSYHGLIKLHGKYTITVRPSNNLSPWIWYQPEKVTAAFENFLNATKKNYRGNLLFEHDLVDVTRQFLQIAGDKVYTNLMAAFVSKNLNRFNSISVVMLEVFQDLDVILNTNEAFMLGKWLEAAKNLTENNLESQINEFNARNQITTWGPTGQIIDYATKQWGGIALDYYKPRWELFINELQICLKENRKFYLNRFRRKVFNDVENPFTVNRKVYPTKPLSDGITIEVSKKIYNKWIRHYNSGLLNHEIPMKWIG